VDRIELEICIPVLERNVDDEEVMNMIQVLAETFFSNVRMKISDDQISRSPYTYLIGNMARQDELTIVPGEFELCSH